MAEQPANGQTPQQPAVQARIVAQYIKDMSFENPSVERMLQGPGENPNLKLEINVNARRVSDGLYESAIDFKADASNAGGTIYICEIVYGAMFKIENLPQQALEPFLLINCPSFIFPFLRRLVADTTREGGFPPLNLDPIDFAALYVHRQQQAKAAAKTPVPANDTTTS
ncbi:MAG: protein-export chaperone SecB [Hyphomicrobiaceae bacterium]